MARASNALLGTTRWAWPEVPKIPRHRSLSAIKLPSPAWGRGAPVSRGEKLIVCPNPHASQCLGPGAEGAREISAVLEGVNEHNIGQMHRNPIVEPGPHLVESLWTFASPVEQRFIDRYQWVADDGNPVATS